MNSMLNQIAKDSFCANADNVAKIKADFESLLNLAREKSNTKQIIGRFGTFCPYLQYIRFDALEVKDYPHNIDRNSIYLCFGIDWVEKKVELHSFGHVWLSPKDKATDKYRYLAMKSMIDIYLDKGGKKFRKTSFKSVTDLFEKLNNYYNVVMQAVTEYTGGYPYKEGIEK